MSASPQLVYRRLLRAYGKRLGWFRKIDYAKAQAYLVKRLPQSVKLYNEFHALFVKLAKEHCRVKPSCPGCPLLEVCAYGRYRFAAA